MKIATWNVNSIRSRLEHVTGWLTDNPVDALCVQETKVTDEEFPAQPFLDQGYHIAISGQKSYNGVAILSRRPLEQVSTGFAPVLGNAIGDLDEQKRVITGVLDGVRILNLYVPNGSSLGSEKYVYKLRWLKTLRDYLQILVSGDRATVMCGDFNIALDDLDIHDPALAGNHIMASEAEREALQAVLEVGLADVFRKFTTEGGHYSWWDYREGSFRRNRGWRIDHLYATSPLYERAIACTIDPTPRKLAKPSDHTPVVLELGDG